MNINIEFGNFWEIMSALGAVGALIIPFFLIIRAYKNNREPIQGVNVHFQHLYMELSKGEYIEGVNSEGAIAIKFEGRMRFYDPSDKPKSLSNLSIIVTYTHNKKDLLIATPILKEGKEYITLPPKATKVIDYEAHQSKKDFSEEQIEYFPNVKDYVLQGVNDEKESQTYKLTI